ncbi:MAG: MFS transporter [Candidatus Dormibacteraeota bacterium]|nr:MFS transporter [Candidatus Dormibacteraeota bacterium]MBO0762805.1 MFS transporter [Candidatus Dormibacteraeota bacterium]
MVREGSTATGTKERSRYVIFGACSIALLMASIDQTIVATALPTLTRELGSPISWTTWTITTYLLGQTVAMPIAGRLSDSWGRKRMFLVFVVTFTLSSLACGLVNNIYLLILFRFIQALGGGGFMPSAMGIVADRFGRDRERAIGLFTSVFPLGALIGPALGGVILSYTTWRLIFFINVPVGITLFVLLAWLLPLEDAPRRPNLDLVGSGLLTATLFGIMLGINQLGEQGPSSLLPWGLLALGGALAVAFVFSQERSPNPVISPALLRRREFGIVNGLNLLYGACALGVFSLVPLFAEEAYGLGPLEAGTLLTARAIGMVVMAVAASMALRRFGYRLPMVAGFILVGIGLFLVATSPIGLGPYTWLGLASIACGLGIGMSGPASNNAAIELLPDQVAAISGLRGMFRQVGGIMGISVAALLVTEMGNPGHTLRITFLGLAALIVAATPLIAGVPERR